MNNTAEQELWIIDYLQHNYSADVVNQCFNDAFAKKFNCKQKFKMWGAMPCPQAIKILKKLYLQGTLVRGIISLGGSWQPGLPKWVYTYTLPNNRRKYTEI